MSCSCRTRITYSSAKADALPRYPGTATTSRLPLPRVSRTNGKPPTDAWVATSQPDSGWTVTIPPTETGGPAGFESAAAVT